MDHAWTEMGGSVARVGEAKPGAAKKDGAKADRTKTDAGHKAVAKADVVGVDVLTLDNAKTERALSVFAKADAAKPSMAGIGMPKQPETPTGEWAPLQLRFKNLVADSSVKYKHSHLTDVGGKDVHFSNIDFSYAVMTRAYFHQAKFEDCKFVGTRFTDCNFRSAVFHNCDFRYADFTGTRVETKEIIKSLPDEPNLRRELLQILRKNAISMGDVRSARTFVIAEIKAKKEHLRLAWRAEGKYYGKYDTLGGRIKIGLKRICLSLDWYLWGHGERLWMMGFSVTLLVALAALLSVSTTTLLPSDPAVSDVFRHFFEALKYYISLFLDVATDARVQQIVWLDWLIVIARYVAFGVLVSGIFRWLSHR